MSTLGILGAFWLGVALLGYISESLMWFIIADGEYGLVPVWFLPGVYLFRAMLPVICVVAAASLGTFLWEVVGLILKWYNP